MRIPTQTEIARLRSRYPAGTRVLLIHMEGDNVPSGEVGTVQTIDYAGRIQTQFDAGSPIVLLPGIDVFRRLTTEEYRLDCQRRYGVREEPDE